MIDLFEAKLLEVQSLVQLAVAVTAMVMVIVVWARTKAFVPTIGALLFGALVTWGVHHSEFLQQKVDEEFQSIRSTVVMEERT